MIESYHKLYEVLDRMSDKLNCGTCGVCENDLIYLLPDEEPFFRKMGIDLIEVEGVHFLVKTPKDGQYCPFRDQQTRTCSIYNNRPAICRMFPLEIKETDEGYWWGMCLYCPKVSNSQNGFRESLIQHIPEIESCLSEEMKVFLGHADRVCSRIELVLGLPTKAALIRPMTINDFSPAVKSRLFYTTSSV
ncbi:MAG: YkgJ family cysteine cluster protein [Nitrospirota bacterium]